MIDDEIAEEAKQVLAQLAEVLARRGEFTRRLQHRANIALRERAAQVCHRRETGQAEEREDIGLRDAVAVKADRLVERRLGVAHAALGVAGDGVERARLGGDLLQLADVARCARISGSGIRRRSKRWQRERIVAGSLWTSVVAKTNFTCAGGSSSVLSSALNAAVESMWTSSMM